MKSERIYLFIKGSQVPHAHIHLIPIYDQEKKEAGRLPRKKISREQLTETGGHLRGCWKN
jgi:diadenosine tetraphosphate (Ap4A) HIT family hydrolase